MSFRDIVQISYLASQKNFAQFLEFTKFLLTDLKHASAVHTSFLSVLSHRALDK